VGVGLLDRPIALVYDRVLAGVEAAGLADERRRLVATARGRVLEIGSGTGANLAALPHDLDRLVLTEPSAGMRRRLALRVARTDRRDEGIEVVDACAEDLPFDDASFDTVVVTLALCSVTDPGAALAEVARVLAPGGRLLLIEHVRGEGRTARLQRILDPVWRRVTGGCRLVRDTRAELERAGFDTSEVDDWSLPGGGPTGPAISGSARRR